MIPVYYYIPIYYYILLFVSLMIFIVTQRYSIFEKENIEYNNLLGYFLLLFVILYIGFRPINGNYFGDMGNYYRFFQELEIGNFVVYGGDVVFSKTMILLLKVFTPESLFVVISVIYVFPLFLFSKIYFKKFWFYSFFLFVATLSFWAYGTNGIRNGMATSIFILGLCYYKRKYILYPILLLSYGIHSSMLLPVIAFILSEFLYYFKKNKIPFYFWLVSILLSVISGNFWVGFFSKFTNEKASKYLTGDGIEMSMFSKSGFRWDFLLYSAIPVVFAYYYVFVKKLKHRLYYILLNIYLICNAFWILIIQAPYSNRFAYLSWFLMSPVIFFPFLKLKIWSQHNMVLGIISLIYYLLTFVFFILR